MRRLWLAAPLALGLSAAAAAFLSLGPDRQAWQHTYEVKLAALPDAVQCERLLRELTRTPHVAGTPGNERVGRFIEEELRKTGLEVTTSSYDVLLSYPKSASLTIVNAPEVALLRREEPLAEDSDTAVPEGAVLWNAYAPSADLTAEVVYVNRGSAADYDALQKLGVDVAGKIVLARYFGGYRGGKSLEAEKRGVAALLVYSDPVDDGWFKGEVYPRGPWGPDSHVQRGANVYDFLVPGDPLTPGWASTEGARRLPESEAVVLPRMPMLPLSARDAAELLKRLEGRAVPEGWQGLAMAATYRIGPGPVRVRLQVENTRERRTIRNILATLRGTDEPEKKVLLSNHYDAWVHGAVDPSSGTASMLELARALGQLAREGYRPRRSIVFGEWDAEEFTLTGSTEWGEEHAADLAENAVVCINVDASTSGPDFSPSASPLLFEALRGVAHDVYDPGSPGKTVAESWKARAGRKNVRSYASGSSQEDELPVSILGSGSDYTVFFNRLGVPSADLIFDGPYGVYHSVYDTYRWMATVGDPGFRYHAAMARYAGVLALRFANADLLPLDAAGYGREIAGYADALAREFPAVAKDLSGLAQEARAWSQAAGAAQKALRDRLAAGALTRERLAGANEWLMTLERGLLDEAGLPKRPWFRHLVYAPLPSYEAETLPAVREALAAKDEQGARREITRLLGKLKASTRAAAAINASRAPRPAR